MKKIILILGLLGFGFCSDLIAGNWYVRKGGPGTSGSACSSNGTNWTNAWGEMDQINWSCVQAGDTVWLAGGATAYTKKMTVNSNGTSAAQIVIKRVYLANDTTPSSAAGWSSSYDSLVTIAVPATGIYAESAIQLDGNYITLDGNIYRGIKIVVPKGRATAVNAVDVNGQNCLVQNIEAVGPGPGVTHEGTLRFLSLQGAYNTSRYNRIDGVNQPYTLSGSGCHDNIIEHDNVVRNGGNSDFDAYHDDIMEYNGATQCTIRYCLWDSWGAEGVMMWNGAGSLYLYGNVFKNGGTGGVVWPSYTLQTQAGPVYFYNNTLINTRASNDLNEYDGNGNVTKRAMGNWAAGSQARNNVYWADAPIYKGTWVWPMSDRDYEFGADANNAGSGAHSIRTGVNPFVNYTGGDYHIVSTVNSTLPRNKGVTLPAPFNMDPDGRVRGSDGGWDMGAYEYGTTVSVSIPHPADTNSDYLMALNESTKYAACWKNPAAFGDCPAGIAIDYAVRAGTLWAGSATGQYQYNSAVAAPLCWEVKP